MKSRPNVNVISLDWNKLSASVLPSPFSFGSYIPALKNIPTVGKVVAKFVDFVIESGYVNGTKNIHFVGQSIGAHVAGSAGNKVEQSRGGKIGRLTGLDIAGPFMNRLNPEDRIGPDKAIFVDNVHTSNQFFGTPQALGTVDFYANGGKTLAQKECLTLKQVISREGTLFQNT